MYNYPHYSLHDQSHSVTIISKIEMLLGEKRINLLSPSDTWLLLMSAYLHDIGMSLTYDLIEETWEDEKFQDHLKYISEKSNDKDLKEAANYLLDIQNEIIGDDTDRENKRNNFQEKWAVKTRYYVTLIIANYFRKNHAENSKNIIQNNNKFSLDENDLFNNRISDLLGEIAYSHQLDFEEMMDLLKYKSDGIYNDKIHPRFIAAMLRMGDLLDLDNGRFNNRIEGVFGKLPNSSKNHQLKHASITHLLVSPEKIEFAANCSNNETYRELKSWSNWLKNEIKNLSINWNNIIPGNFESGPPTIGNFDLLINNRDESEEQADLRFNLSQEKAFDIIEGSGIYDNNLVFIREIIQNAIDANKIQLWRDIKKNGIYDGMLNAKKIRYPKDIPKEIYDNYYVKINIEKYEQGDDNCSLKISIEDRGCGFTKDDLNRLADVGDSWKSNYNNKKLIASMPFWLKPTAAYGMGLQSAFLVTDEIEIETNPPAGTAKKISMVSRKNDGYITVKTLDSSDIKRGSKVVLTTNKDILHSFSGTVVNSFDTFSDDSSTLYIYSIIEYLKRNLYGDLFKIEISSGEVGYIEEAVADYMVDSHKNLKYHKGNDCYYALETEGKVCFHIWDEDTGSYLNMEPDPSSPSGTDLFLRGISLDSRSLRINITDLNINWNLLSPATDKIVDLSRENILSGKKKDVYSKFHKIYERALSLFIENLRDKTDIEHKIKFILDLKGKAHFDNHQLLISEDYNSKSNYPPYINYKNNKKTNLTYQDFFNQDEFLVLSEYARSSIQKEINFSEIIKEIDFKNLDQTIPIIDNSRYYKKYLLNNYRLDEIVLSKSHGISNVEVYLLTKEKANEFTEIKVEDKYKKAILRNLKNDRYRQRGIIYAIEPYAKVLAVDEKPNDLFNNFPEFDEKGIISPFSNKNNDRIKDMFPDDLNKKENKKKEIIKNIVDSNIELILDDGLINWVNENSINHEKYGKKDIKASYIELITDYYYYCR
ncbi:HD domain-containing protein [Halanaerobium congolense]|uniref:HD domain-containing protein n=1 Tax=Halanaerobium congolense TaxID=54121 RepID=UPI000889B495|nr:ATP-binding protein [Halanaerobium congolense]SDK65858.1 Histidine kinase-, DNA gyrase B-, and HSP90-like ATPase [Halanaerobium congolense]SDM32300.1 Histidine kinase-, DNA gyrase B-, and HSP90-like ATPase [Halanaerobium congolense]